MVECDRTHHLPSQRQSGSNSVTIGASQILRRIMLRVVETNAKGGCSLRRSNETTKLMAGAARRNTAAIRLRLWCVATKANRMGVEPSGNRKRHTATTLSMAGCTTCPRRRMSSMIELHIETSQGRKRLYNSRLDVCVTD
jgi:hypothetical protein